jgi:hypothetical protein
MVRNVTEPDFGSLDAFTLRRHARAGGSFTTTPRSRVIGAVTLSVDADLMKVPRVTGEEQRVAVGGEVWTPRRGLGFRGGASRSAIGDQRSVFSGGASVAFRAGLFLDAQFTGGGSDESRDGWGLAFRVTF